MEPKEENGLLGNKMLQPNKKKLLNKFLFEILNLIFFQII